MPIIHVELLKGRSVEQKRLFAEAVIKAAASILSCAPEDVDVTYAEREAENWWNRTHPPAQAEEGR